MREINRYIVRVSEGDYGYIVRVCERDNEGLIFIYVKMFGVKMVKKSFHIIYLVCRKVVEIDKV